MKLVSSSEFRVQRLAFAVCEIRSLLKSEFWNSDLETSYCGLAARVMMFNSISTMSPRKFGLSGRAQVIPYSFLANRRAGRQTQRGLAGLWIFIDTIDREGKRDLF